MTRQNVPIYEYRCEDCNHVHAYLAHVDNRETDRICPECQGVARFKLSATKTTFKEADKSGIKKGE